MTSKLDELLVAAAKFQMSETEREEQRRSFAYGSAKIENEDVTREMIDVAARRLSK